MVKKMEVGEKGKQQRCPRLGKGQNRGWQATGMELHAQAE
jgi:hypothetical protein